MVLKNKNTTKEVEYVQVKMVQPASNHSNEKLVFSIEACRDCKSHQWHTMHDEQRYQNYYQMIYDFIK